MASESQSLAAQLRSRRTEMMLTELEAVALRLFAERGFAEVTVEEIASEARVSVRTFYRYFPAKEDVLQLRIARRTEAMGAALVSRPADEPLLESLRHALEEEASTGDAELLRRWIDVVARTPGVLRGVMGGLQLKTYQRIAEFFAGRLGQSSRDPVPTVLAAAAGGVIQAAHTQWYFHGGDLGARLSEALEALDAGLGADPGAWRPPAGGKRPPRPRPRR